MNASYERALILHDQRRYADAETELKQVLAAEPDNAHAHAMLAQCLAERGELVAANAEADQAVGLAPHFAFGHYVRARVLTDRRRYEEARPAIREALRLESFNPSFYAALARIEMEQRRWPAALDAAENGLSIDPDHAPCLNLRAMALVHLGRKNEAAQTIDGALERDPHNAVTHANQGWTLLHQGDHKKALEHFRESLRLNPELEWAKAGTVEALKARYLIYRLMLRYFLFMSRLALKAQWGLIIGAYVGYQILLKAANAYPDWRPLLWSIAIAYVAFTFMTWVASPLFNLMLRLNRFGRHALSRDQRVASNWVGGMLLAALLCTGWFLAGRPEAGFAALCLALLVMPVSRIFGLPRGWPRWALAAGTAATAAVGISMIVAAHIASRQDDAAAANLTGQLGNAFVIGLVVLVWGSNLLAGVRVKR